MFNMKKQFPSFFLSNITQTELDAFTSIKSSLIYSKYGSSVDNMPVYAAPVVGSILKI